MSHKIAIAVAYDGAEYHGWQRQKHDPKTVQEALETAISFVADHDVNVVCSGRTDAGVHGTEQIAHFDTKATRSSKSWVFGINSQLPKTIRVNWAISVPDTFHARFHAIARRYRYVIYTSPVAPALLNESVSWCRKPLDAPRMHEAAQHLVGTHDFTSYRAVACQNKEPVKTVHHVHVQQHGAYIVIDIQASGFLMHMVRNIAGVLMKVGCGDADPKWAKSVLEAKNRCAADVTASPYGLYFVRAYYDSVSLPQLPLGPAFLDMPDMHQDANDMTTAGIESDNQSVFAYHKSLINNE